MSTTSTRIFEALVLCSVCELPASQRDIPDVGECPGTCGGGFKTRSYRGEFLVGAVDRPHIELRRLPNGRATANIAHAWVVHSPDGFEWGYGGSGPADLALNILGYFVHPPEAWRLHQRFKFDVIARIARDADHVVIRTGDIINWILDHWAGEGHG